MTNLQILSKLSDGIHTQVYSTFSRQTGEVIREQLISNPFTQLLSHLENGGVLEDFYLDKVEEINDLGLLEDSTIEDLRNNIVLQLLVNEFYKVIGKSLS